MLYPYFMHLLIRVLSAGTVRNPPFQLEFEDGPTIQKITYLECYDTKLLVAEEKIHISMKKRYLSYLTSAELVRWCFSNGIPNHNNECPQIIHIRGEGSGDYFLF